MLGDSILICLDSSNRKKSSTELDVFLTKKLGDFRVLKMETVSENLSHNTITTFLPSGEFVPRLPAVIGNVTEED